ncbi:3D domain-containing protein [Neobacillus niacini]|uniref:PcsB-like coiled-coil domain-containing protein n=1 Tax=Neobacillus niacini TaxID=86668 RepID=UPI0028634A56|nr:3D domain-containing protein [Neobacillus niacini]MDR6999305.1 peptidoglycan hydrolase CwlO-like protein [Neobacillus niacini]
MQFLKRMILVILTLTLCGTGSIMTYAKSNTEALHNVEQDLQQKAQEKQSVSNEMNNIKQEMDSIYKYISANKEALAKTQKRIDATNQLIEQKKEEIVTVEDKILARKDVMKKRLVALQHDNNVTLVVKVLFDAKSFDDFLQRASAVSTLFSADQNILEDQKHDLKQIEEDKKEIDQQEQVLKDEQKNLAAQQEQLSLNLQKRQDTLKEMQDKYSKIDKEMAQAQKEKASIQAEIKAAQDRIREEQAAARSRAAAVSAGSQQNASAPSGKGETMYVTATAYCYASSGPVTRLGYNIKNNPNMKLIAVDPSVIPLGSKVWVEGYGVAIAGDTGGAIHGHRIDILKPTKSQALAFGRRTVKVIILD